MLTPHVTEISRLSPYCAAATPVSTGIGSQVVRVQRPPLAVSDTPAAR
jgi:hypothetical protein